MDILLWVLIIGDRINVMKARNASNLRFKLMPLLDFNYFPKILPAL
jgi:hypothetical protein